MIDLMDTSMMALFGLGIGLYFRPVLAHSRGSSRTNLPYTSANDLFIPSTSRRFGLSSSGIAMALRHHQAVCRDEVNVVTYLTNFLAGSSEGKQRETSDSMRSSKRPDVRNVT